MKIGLVLPYSLTYYGGVQKHVLSLYEEFKKLGHQVKIFVPKASLEEKYKNKDIILIGGALNIPFEATSTLSFGLTAKGYSINRYFEKENFDILHFHNPTAPFLAGQILLASKTTNIASFHADLVDQRIYDNYAVVIKSLYDYLLPKVHGFIAVSESAKHSLISIYPKAQATLIPIGVDIDRFTAGQSIKKFKDGKFNLLCVSRLDERKGIFYLLEAFHNLKKKYPQKLRLILVGDGPQRWEVNRKIGELKIENEVILIGQVEEQKLPNYYKTANLMVAPATHGESFGVVLIEAMAANVPIVAAANRGYQDILKSVADNCLVEPRNSHALALKISEFIKNKNLSQKIKDWEVKEIPKYSVSKIALKILNYYEQCLSKKNDR